MSTALPTCQQIDIAATIANAFNRNATLPTFQAIFPEREYNAEKDWDDPDLPYNHMWKRYRCFKGDLCALTPEGILLRIACHLQPRGISVETIFKAWLILGRFSHGLGLGQFLEIAKGDGEEAQRLLQRFESTQRCGSLFWEQSQPGEREAIYKWFIPEIDPTIDI